MVTDRDRELLRDLAMSHVLSRDQVVELGYFGSVTRANTRLRLLRKAGWVRVLETPFFQQHLYSVTAKAVPLLGEQVGRLAARRAGSPRFLQHALSVTNVRLALARRGAETWRFEQQLRTSFSVAHRSYEVRPDGAAVVGGKLILAEVDLGHVAPYLRTAEHRTGSASAQPPAIQ